MSSYNSMNSNNQRYDGSIESLFSSNEQIYNPQNKPIENEGDYDGLDRNDFGPNLTNHHDLCSHVNTNNTHEQSNQQVFEYDLGL